MRIVDLPCGRDSEGAPTLRTVAGALFARETDTRREYAVSTESHRGAFVKRLAVSAVTMATGAALLLSGCVSGNDAATETSSAAQQRDFPAVYQQVVDWQECGPSYGFRDGLVEYLNERGAHVDGLRCAWITVPLNWDDPGDERTIRLSTLHIPATGDAPIGTLFSNPGGPGASGTEFALGLTASTSFAAVHEKYDLLGFDPRGISRSTPVKCESDTQLLELKLALCADQDPLALSMGSTQVARDMELMRTLVGDDLMHYSGFSYGTVIGATYATLFPEKVGRIMLDSAWPSNWSSLLGTYQQYEAVARARNELLAGCGTDYEVKLCPIRNERAFLQTTARLDDHPLVASDGTVINGDVFREYLTTALYQLRAGRQRVLDISSRALAGEQAAVDDLAAVMSGGGANLSLSGLIVRCLSSPRDPHITELYEYINDRGLPIALGGPDITDETLGPFVALRCEGLPDSGEDYLDFSYDGTSPILVFGITGDHATPYEGARQLVKELGNATLMTLEGSGHIATYQDRSSCADAIANAYLLRGEMPDEGRVCTDD